MFRKLSNQTFSAQSSLFRIQTELQYGRFTLFRGIRGLVSPQAINSSEVVVDNNLDLEYIDYRKAYEFRKSSEIARAMFVFRLCSYPIFVKHSLQLMTVGKKVLGRRLFTSLMTSTFCGQFIGGESTEDLLKTVAALQKASIGPLLCIPIEEDIGSTEYRRKVYDDNLAALLHCVSLATEVDQAHPMSQMKLTALVPGNVCGSLSNAIIDSGDDHAYLDAIVRVLEGGKLELDALGMEEQGMLDEALQRCRILGEHLENSNVRLFIDAEYTYLNPALRIISLAMMLRYNKKRPLVAYTYQNYLKQTFSNLHADVELVRSRGACFGAKVVRGAYMLSERALAKSKGYPDPVHDTFEDTTRMYYKSMEYLLNKTALDPDKFLVMAASHNKDTVQYVLNIMEEKKIPRNGGSVFFGQVFGMCDFLSSTLGLAGYLVYKSIPYGPMEECVPYLHRRAVENSSLLGATQCERILLKKAFKDRLSGGHSDTHYEKMP